MRDPYRPGIRGTGQFRGYGWFHIPAWNITIAAPPKGGSSSLKQFMWMNEIDCSYIPQHQVRGPCFFVVRDPISRFCSLWRSKCRDRKDIANDVVHGMSPSQLLHHIESGARDVHWTPQYKLIGNLRPTLIPLEKLNEWWTEQGYGELKTFNVTQGDVDINPKKIADYYWRDMFLYTQSIMTYDAARQTDQTEIH